MKLLVTVALLLTTPLAFADELDNEQSVTNVAERAKDLPATLVMRTNIKTGAVEVAHLKDALSETQLSEGEAAKMAFTEVKVDEKYDAVAFNELDTDNSRVSWYFYFGYTPYYGYGYGYNYYYYPTYAYYGYNYSYYPYYGYYYGAYAYSYYRPYSPYWW